MSLITKILCSVTILVAAVSLTVPGVVFAGGGPIIPSTNFEFNLTIQNDSNTDIQYVICAGDSSSNYFNYPTYDATRDTTSGIAAGKNSMVQQIPATKKYLMHVYTSLANTDISKGIKVVVSPALTQPARYRSSSDCANTTPSYAISTVLVADNTNKKIVVSGASNATNAESISELRFNQQEQNIYSAVPVTSPPKLSTFIAPFNGAPYKLCIDGVTRDMTSTLTSYDPKSQLILTPGEHTIQFPQVNTGCSLLNYTSTFIAENNVTYGFNRYGDDNNTIFLAASTSQPNNYKASVIFMRGNYPVSAVCIDGVIKYEQTSGMGNFITSVNVHNISYPIGAQCPDTSTQINLIEGSNTVSQSGYFDQTSYYTPAKPGFYASEGITDEKPNRINKLSINGVITNEAYPDTGYFEFSGTKTVGLVDQSDEESLSLLANPVRANTVHTLTYNDPTPQYLTLLYDYKPSFVLSGLTVKQVNLVADLNNDGTPDSQQTNIVSTVDDTTGNNLLYVNTKNNKPVTMSKKGYEYYQAQAKNKDYTSFPFGLADFTITGALPGEVNSVDIGYLMTSSEFDVFMTDALKTRTKSNNANERVITTADIQNTRLRVIKWVPSTPGGTDFDFRDFTSKISKIDTTQPATTINGKSYKKIVVSLDLVDGQYGDATGVDGKIVDPIGLALTPDVSVLSTTGNNLTLTLVATGILSATAIGATIYTRTRKTK